MINIIATTTRLICIIILLFSLGMIFYRLYKKQYQYTRSVMILSVFTMFWSIVSSIAAEIEPVTLLSHTLRMVSIQLSSLFMYFAIDRFLNPYPSTSRRSLFKQPALIATIVLIMVAFIFDVYRHRSYNLTSFVEDLPYRPEWSYYLSHLVSHVLILYLSLSMVSQWHQNLLKTTTIEYKARMILMIIGFGTGAALAYLVIINILLSVFIGDAFRTSINLIYHLIKPFMYGAVALAVALSPKDYKRLLPHQLRDWHDKQVNTRLQYLRSVLQSIAPSSMGNTISTNNIHLIRDILDAREMILSNFPPTHNTYQQSQYIIYLVLNKQKIKEYGPYTAPIFSDDALTYSLSMSYYVQKYQTRFWHGMATISHMYMNILKMLIQMKARLFSLLIPRNSRTRP